MIENKNIITSERFKKDILSNGNVFLFDEKKIYPIKCFNKQLKRPENYKCCEIECKKIMIYNYHISFLENC